MSLFCVCARSINSLYSAAEPNLENILRLQGPKSVIDINLILSYRNILAQLLMFSQPTDIKSK